MRVLYHHRTQAEDGQAVHIRALQRALREEGHQVTEVGLVNRDSRAADASAGKPGSALKLVTRLPRFARELAEYSYTAFARGRILAAGRDLNADFIYERYAFGNGAGVMAAQRLRIPLILEVNSPMVLELERTRGLAFPATARRMESWILRSADRVCAVTQVLAEMLIELGAAPERVFVTPNGVHLEAYEYGDRALAREKARGELGLGAPAAQELVLGFVGYYRDWHRLDLALDALARPALAKARLVIVGDGPAHDALVRHAAVRSVSSRVHFAGPRRHEQIPSLLPAFDVALVPAINPYASPLKLFEYMAAEVCPIAPDQPNLREVLDDGRNALLVAPGDGGALARALERLASEPELRLRLGRAARATVVERDLTWRGNARRVIHAAEELLAARAR